MGRIILFAAIAVAAIFAIATFMRRRSGDVLEYEVHPPYPESDWPDDDQVPSYYGGENLGRTEGFEHFPARSGN